MIIFPDISPDIFSVSIGNFELALRWYAMSYILGIILGWRLAVLTIRRSDLWPKNQAPMEPVQIEDLLTYVVIGVIVGGRLGYVIFYKPMEYAANPFDIIKVWQGGMSFHGGLLGVGLATFIYYRRNLVPLLSGADLLALCAPIGLMLGRIANFINAELWGRPTDMPWGVAFPGEMAQACGQVSGLCARHPTQLYEALLEGLILALIVIFLVFKRDALKRPGRITGLFFLGYGMARYFVEFFRQPDAHFQSFTNPMGFAIQAGPLGITMGQILSLPMIILGAYFIWYSFRQARL